MKSIDFPGAFMKIGEGQDQYHTIHALPVQSPDGQVIAIYELTDEEVAEIVKNKKLFYSRLTFGQLFQPMQISAFPLPIKAKLIFENCDPEEFDAFVGPDGVTIPEFEKTPEGKFVRKEMNGKATD